VALLAYPRPFRQRYGGALVQVFHDRCRAAARQEGARGLLRVCAEELADLAATVLKEHADDVRALRGRGRVPHQCGGRCGAVLGGLWMVETVATNLVPVSGHIARSIMAMTLLAMPLVFAVAGFRTAQRTRTARAGTYAGIVTAVISSALMLGCLLIVMALFWRTVRAHALHDADLMQDFQHSHARTFDQFLWGDTLGGASVLAVYALLYGSLVGTVGGLLGSWSRSGPLAHHRPSQGSRVPLIIGALALPVAGLLALPRPLMSALVLAPVVLGLAALVRARRAPSTTPT
jgi:hypothetical protein